MASAMVELMDLLESEGSEAVLAWLRVRGAAGLGPVHLVEGEIEIADALTYAEGLLAMGLDAVAAEILAEAVAAALQPEAGLGAVA